MRGGHTSDQVTTANTKRAVLGLEDVSASERQKGQPHEWHWIKNDPWRRHWKALGPVNQQE